MKKLSIIFSVLLVLSSCGKHRMVCTDELRMLIVHPVNNAGEPVRVDSYKVILQRTGEDITERGDSSQVLLISDASRTRLSRKGDELLLTVYVMNQSHSRKFVVADDGCHIDHISGDLRMVIP